MQHLTVTVSNTAELLTAAPDGYGAGALLRWESCATVDGTYVEGGTEALVSGTSSYDIWDTAGTSGTFYRTRISDAAGTTFSAYTAPFLAAGVLWSLSVDQFRLFITTELDDEAVQMLLTAAEQAIVAYAGPWGEISERFHPHGELLRLSQVPLSITSIVETNWGSVTGTTLSADDYVIRGQTVRRLTTGTHPRWGWHPVDVTYVPADDMAERQRVQMGLVKLDIASSGTLASFTIGAWSETYRTDLTNEQQRADLLATLAPAAVGIY